MKKQTLALVILPLWLPLNGCGNGLAQRALKQEPSVVKSTEDNKASIDYKIGRRQLLPKRPHMLLLQISIAPELFVREKMTQLAQKLNGDFSNERKVVATILDDERIAQNPPPAGAEYSLFEKVNRGQYYLDRARGHEYIAFSTERGKPANQVVINFGPNRPNWLRPASRSKSRR